MKDTLNILCPFCNAVFSAKMEEDLHSASGCESCGYGSEPSGTIDIRCGKCDKLVYRKEID